jgi:peptidoglycan-associated lipoprotein
MKQLALALSLAALLAGCADTPKDAVIEDRGIKTQPKTGDAPDGSTQGASTQGVTMSPLESRPLGGAGAGQAGSGQKVETQALADPTTEVKPLDAGGAGTGTTGADGAAALTPEQRQAAIALQLKDPNSPLSKRIIHFDYDSSAIRDEYRSLLEAHAEFLKSNPASKVILQGHADERGSREYNLALGQRRAESVFKAMSLLGVTEAQIEPVSMGEEKPLAEGHDESAWQQNRRTEILYHGE